jgi:hypothetical protein
LVDLRLEGFRMSNSQKSGIGEVRAAEETGKEREQNQRFTPLRSYVSRPRALSREACGELTLSRLIPVPRLQG